MLIRNADWVPAKTQDTSGHCTTNNEQGTGYFTGRYTLVQTGNFLHCAHRRLDKNIVSTTAPERAVLSVMSLGVALRTDESGASEAAETFIFLASI